MVNYKDLGLVNTREMFAKAIKGGYAIPAFNFNNMEGSVDRSREMVGNATLVMVPVMTDVQSPNAIVKIAQ